MKKQVTFLYILFIILFSLRCGGSKSTSQKKIFRYNEAAGVNTLDPANARYLEDMRVINQIFDGLVELDDSMNVIPCIAKEYSISADGLEYTFNLRDDVFFTSSSFFPDGKKRKVTAHDFVFSFNRILDPKVASPGMWIFKQVDKENTPFTALNDLTLKIKLKDPFPAFLGILTMPYCNVVPKEVVDHFGEDFRNNPIGSGAFKLAFW